MSFLEGYSRGLELLNQMKSLKQRDEEMEIMRERQAELARHQQLALEVTKQGQMLEGEKLEETKRHNRENEKILGARAQNSLNPINAKLNEIKDLDPDSEEFKAGMDFVKTASTAKAAPKNETEVSLAQKAAAGDASAQRVLDKLNGAREKLAVVRGRAFGSSRPVATIDDEGMASYEFAGDAIKGGSTPLQGGMNIMAKRAQMGEIKVASGQMRKAIEGLDRDFTPDQITKLTLAMSHDDPGVINTNIETFLGTQQLTDKQQDFVVWAAQLNERALSLRNIAGMGQGAQDLRSAIQATLPSVKSGSKGMASKQLDAFDNQVRILEEGIPKMRKSRPADGGLSLDDIDAALQRKFGKGK